MRTSKKGKDVCEMYMPPEGCANIYPLRPPMPEPKTCIASNEIAGDFYLPCNTNGFTIWGTTELLPSGSVSVFYEYGCASELVVTVTNSTGMMDTFQVPPHTTVSRSYADVTEVEITCQGEEEEGRCKGTYCITIDYPIEVD
ncbi:S-Ena type endospore appendage [Pontibacillus salicampi]|uniref:S-Ena type endospore appendage n=1 Tax=Pontibacillus salicampi TaxID=1449801 RepID=A0ABV6LIA9_9BACI